MSLGREDVTNRRSPRPKPSTASTPHPRPATGPKCPHWKPRPGPQDLSDDYLWEGWTERMLFHTLAALMLGARTVLHCIADAGGTTT